MSKKGLSIVLPCYNPAEGWERNVLGSFNKLKDLLPQINLQLLIVNDGSQRNWNESLIKTLKADIPDLVLISYPQNQGKGYALRKGIEQVQNELCIYTDIDFPYQEDSIAGLYHKLAGGDADIIPGIRESSYYCNVPAGRVRISRALKYLTGKFLKMQVTDTQCGLKGFNQKGKAVFLKTSIKRYLFDLEFIYLATLDKSIRVSPYIVKLKPDVVFSKMNIKILFRESLSFLNILRRFYFKR